MIWAAQRAYRENDRINEIATVASIEMLRDRDDAHDRLYAELAKTDGIVKDEQGAMDILSIVGRRGWKNKIKNLCKTRVTLKKLGYPDGV